MSQSNKLTRYVGSVTVATTISRIFGYIRDMFIAQLFGAGIVADAFYAAYRIPNLLRRLLGEGSMSASFVPVFTEYVDTKSKEETQELLNVVFTTLLTILGVITVLGIIFARPITFIITNGFASTPEKMNLTVTLTRIMFPYLILTCMAALTLGVLNSNRSFFLPALSPIALSISEIIYVLLVSSFFITLEAKVKWLAIFILIGGLGQYIPQQIGVLRLKYKIGFKYSFKHEGFRKIFTLMLPVMIGFSVDQINAFVDMICASFLAHGSMTVLYYSNRLMQFPLAIFGIAVSTVALPSVLRPACLKTKNSWKQHLQNRQKPVLYPKGLYYLPFRKTLPWLFSAQYLYYNPHRRKNSNI